MDANMLSNNVDILYDGSEGKSSSMATHMEDIKVIVSDAYCRKPFTQLDTLIDTKWKQEVTKNPRLYNGKKFRIDHVEMQKGGDPTLFVGLTDYKEFICVNQGDNVNDIFEYGKQEFGNKHACMGDAMGVSALTVTQDEYIIFIRRSHWVGEAKGLLDLPGGHAEPDEMAAKCNIPDLSNLSNIKGEEVRYEIFHSVLREARDEINLPEESLTWPLLLGVIRDYTVGGKPACSFLMRCSLSKEAVFDCYSKGGPEGDESSYLTFLHTDELLKDKSELLEEMLPQMASCATAGLYFYKKNILKSRNE